MILVSEMNDFIHPDDADRENNLNMIPSQIFTNILYLLCIIYLYVYPLFTLYAMLCICTFLLQICYYMLMCMIIVMKYSSHDLVVTTLNGTVVLKNEL